MMVATRHTPHALLGILLRIHGPRSCPPCDAIELGKLVPGGGFLPALLEKKASEAHYVNASRLATLFLVVAAAWVSMQLQSVSEGWKSSWSWEREREECTCCGGIRCG